MSESKLNRNSQSSLSSSQDQDLVPPLSENTSLVATNPKSQRKGFVFGVIIGCALTFVGLKLLGGSPSENTPMVTPDAPQKQKSTQSVTITEIKTAQVNDTLEATGTVTASELIPVMTQATGLQITEVFADEGDLVKSGQILAKLDDSILTAELAQAQALVKQAEARLAELKAGARSEELQRSQENVKFAQADVKQAELDLDLAGKKVARNRNLAEEGAIARDRFDEILNQQKVQESALNKAKARLREAQQQLKELQQGVRPEIITQAEANLKEAKARVQVVTAQLNHSVVNAPVSGIVAARNARVGDVTSSFNSEKLFTIIENGKLELQVKVPETQLGKLKIGQPVKITADANPELNINGRIKEIEPLIDQESRQATVNVDLPSNLNLKPGMFLKASLIFATRESLVVPMNAVVPQSDQEAIVYTVNADNIAQAKNITMGEILPNEQIEVRTGLKKGDRIVVKGAAYLKDGDKVNY